MFAAISPRAVAGATAARIERLRYRADRIELRLRLDNGEMASATLLDDGVNSLELTKGGTVYVLASSNGAGRVPEAPATRVAAYSRVFR